jgi:hypothetical protein
LTVAQYPRLRLPQGARGSLLPPTLIEHGLSIIRINGIEF